MLGLLSACATTGGSSSRDPLEPINRAVFGFNETLDQVLIKPVAQGYRAVLPEIARTGVTNFFSNIEDVWIAANNLLQGKPESALQDVMRVVINTVIGLCIGGAVHNWLVGCLIIFIVAPAALIQGIMSGTRTSSYVALAISAVALLLTAA